ncbi:MAG: hypothetical protein M1833_007181 [Piccolia ochrophora]|nr:MAG: hypothetical protein M1833_007181 [Piccolia ochrophora]
MFSPLHYTVPSPGFVPYDFAASTPTSPEGYYSSPRYSVNTSSPQPRSSKRHSRRASHDASGYGYGYASPRPVSRHNSAPEYGDGSPRAYSTPQRKAEHVSKSDRTRSKSSRFWVPLNGYWSGRAPSRSYQAAFDSSDEDLLHDYTPYTPLHRASYRPADEYVVYGEQVPAYAEAEPTVRRSRARRSSHSTPKSTPKKSSPKTPPRPTKPAPQATESDRVRAGIPAGYSIKNWDPTEEPVTLLGSVFDANSLGKWIYDWTVYHHGAGSPMTEIAGELWLLLIQLSGKVKRAEECLPRIRKVECRDMVEDFLESGERLWDRFRKLLKSCEAFMWKAARRESSNEKRVSMGKASGCEFVDSIFGRDRELERTEKLMQGMRLWSMRFDANCEDILRRPTA